MAVQMQPHSFILPEKFEKLNFTGYESTDSMSTVPSTPSTPGSPPAVDIEFITKEDHDEVLDFLCTFFFRDEPLNFSLQLINDDKPRCYELEDYCLKDLDNGVNLKAMLNGKMVGVCLNGFLERGFLEELEPVQCKNEKFAKILTLLDHVAVQSDVFQHFPDCDKAMVLKVISVNGEYRGKGIAKELMAKTRELAKQHGCGFMTVDCSSHFTAMALKKLGFNKMYGLNYSDYKVDGKVVFTPAQPHAAVTVYTQRIQ